MWKCESYLMVVDLALGILEGDDHNPRVQGFALFLFSVIYFLSNANISALLVGFLKKLLDIQKDHNLTYEDK